MQTNPMNILRQVLVVIATIATITVNILANALPINDQTTGEVSANFDAAFTPAPYVFNIWFLIYVGLIAYAIYQALPAQRDDPRLRSIDFPYLVAAAANITWIFLWHYNQVVLSVLVIVVLLASLIRIYLQLDIGRSDPSPGRRWTVDLTFSVYLGWVTVATIANIGAMLDSLGWSGGALGEAAWFAVAVALALAAAGLVAWTRADVAYLAVFVWAFIGLGVRHMGEPSLSATAWTGTALAIGLLLLAIVRRARATPQPALTGSY